MSSTNNLFAVKNTINCRGIVLDFTIPRIMGILNITPDSFFDGGRYLHEPEIVKRASTILSEGADIIDVGAYSSRPGASDVSTEEEVSRLGLALKAIRREFPNAILSVDTFRAETARYAVKEFGVNMINDISAGLLDSELLPVVGTLKVPYVLMHMKGTPADMQRNPSYHDITRELLDFFARRIEAAALAGINDILIDPGFGFGKTLEDNFKVLHELRLFEMLGYPLMVGLSRKSMIYKSLQITPQEALNGTTILHTLALNNGAKLLRVHDVKEAAETVSLYQLYHSASNKSDNLL
jgi:dihydropteroate synthase